MGRKGQYATEYMIIVGFSALLLLPLILLFMGEYVDMQYSVNAHQAYTITQKVANAALKVYYLGEGSMITVPISVPNQILTSSVDNYEILYKIKSKADLTTDIYTISRVNVTGTLPTIPGNYELKITSKGDYVWVEHS